MENLFTHKCSVAFAFEKLNTNFHEKRKRIPANFTEFHRVWVGFGASWRGGSGTLCIFFQFQLNFSLMFGNTHSIMFGKTHGIMFGRTLSVLCSEGHFLSIVFRRTLFEYCVRKDTLHYVRKDTFQNMMKTFWTNSHLLTLKWSEYLRHVKRNP